jgi:2-methylcitrate dehydratase PrpD
VAVMLLEGTASFTSAHDITRMQDPAVLRQRAKVKLIPDEELERQRPAREANVEVVLTDGQKFSRHVNAVRGTAQNPMTREEVMEKCRDLMAPVLGNKQCDALTTMVLALEKQGDLRGLRPLLQVG